MSSTPDREWPASSWQPPPYVPGPAPSLKWRIGHSLWLLLPLVGCGCFGSIGLLYVGIRARRASWWIPALGYLSASIVSFAVIGPAKEDSTELEIGTGVMIATWIICLLHCALINPAWLQWSFQHRPWYSGISPLMPPVSPYRTPPVRQGPPNPMLPRLGVPSPGTYYAESPALAPVNPPVLDVNSAAVAELALLPGFDQSRAELIAARRQARGGFETPAQFAAAAGLEPHEFARIRHLITCRPWPEESLGQPPVPGAPLPGTSETSVPGAPGAPGAPGLPESPAGPDSPAPHQGRILDV